MKKNIIILIVGIGLLSVFGWSQIPPSTPAGNSLDGYRSTAKPIVVYQTVRQGGSASYSSSGSYSSSSSSSGGSYSYGK